MGLETIEANLDNFNSVFNMFGRNAAIENHLKFILFLADKDPETSFSWCHDCNLAEPIIDQKFEAANSDIAVLKVYVGGMMAWQDPNHRFRYEESFMLQDVPTLLRWEFDGITGRLESYEFYEGNVESKIDALLSDN